VETLADLVGRLEIARGSLLDAFGQESFCL
jgi:hypothetical protein